MSEEAILENEEIEEVEAAAEEAAEAEEARELTIEEQLEVALAESAKNLEGWQRAQAEFANARKRFDKQRIDAYTNAKADVISKLLPAIDDFDRAMDNVPEALENDGWFEGVQLVQRKLGNILEHFNVVPIDAVGQEFDPNVHEALSQEPSDEFESGAVTRELQKGYKVGDRVIRPSLVYVAE